MIWPKFCNVVAAGILDNEYSRNKLPEGTSPDIRSYIVDGVLVGIDVNSGELQFYLFRFPEKRIERFVQRSADGNAETDCRVVVPFFNRVDRLPGYADKISQLLLREVFGGSGRLHFKIFHQSPSLFSLTL
jgi:hypothetical protein